MAEDLHAKRCVPCEGGVRPLESDAIENYLQLIDGWRVAEDVQGSRGMPTIQKRFVFDDFRSTMSFLRLVEDVAEAEGHHPDFCVHYNRLDFTIWTHAIGGLHENDFILASKIDQLFKAQNDPGAKGREIC